MRWATLLSQQYFWSCTHCPFSPGKRLSQGLLQGKGYCYKCRDSKPSGAEAQATTQLCREEAACARACCSLLHVGMTAPRTGLLLGSLTWLSHRVTAPHRETTQVFLNQCILRQVFFLFFLSHKINCVPQNFHYEVQFCHSNSN